MAGTADKRIGIRIESEAELAAFTATAEAAKKVNGELEKQNDLQQKLSSGGGLASSYNPSRNSSRDAALDRAARKESFAIADPEALKAAESARKALVEYRKTVKDGSEEAKGLDVRIRALELSLKGEEAQLVRQVQAMQRLIAAQRAAGVSTSDLERRLTSSQAKLAVYQRDPPVIPVSAAERSNAAVGRLSASMINLGNSIVRGRFSVRSFVSVLSSAGPVLGAVVGGVLALVAASLKAVVAFAQWESETAKLKGSLAISGRFTQEYADQIDALSGKLSKASGIAKGEWVAALGEIAPYLDPKDLDSYGEALANLTGFFKGDAKAAAEALRGAMQDNFEQFEKFGIYIDQTATHSEKMVSLFNQIKGGSKALAEDLNTLSGQWNALKNAGEQYLTVIGGLITKTSLFTPAIRLQTQIFQFLNDKLGFLSKSTSDLKNNTDAATKSLDHSKDTARNVAREMDNLADKYKHLNNEIDRLKQLNDAVNEQQKTRDEKQKDNEIALVENAVEKKRITQEEGLRRKAFIEEKYRRIEVARNEQALHQELEIDKQKLVAKEQERREMFTKIGDIEAKQKAGTATPEDLKAKEELDKKLRDSIRERDDDQKAFEFKRELTAFKIGGLRENLKMDTLHGLTEFDTRFHSEQEQGRREQIGAIHAGQPSSPKAVNGIIGAFSQTTSLQMEMINATQMMVPMVGDVRRELEQLKLQLKNMNRGK